MRFTKQLLAGLLASAMLPAAVPAFAAEGRTNIALGKSYTIESDAPNENSLGTTEEGGKITDAYGTSNTIPALGAFRQRLRAHRTIDLGLLCRWTAGDGIFAEQGARSMPAHA
ncbi:MAG: hypothetical protein ACLUFV_13755 [Acutalibacteraceae bacterium]